MFVLELIRRLNDQEDGATAAEYGVMVAAILAVIIATVLTLGEEVRRAVTDVVDAMR